MASFYDILGDIQQQTGYGERAGLKHLEKENGQHSLQECTLWDNLH
jgi:hypothetical protein